MSKSTAAASYRRRIFIGTVADTPTLGKLRIRHDQAVGVDEKGKIAFVKASSDGHDWEDAEIVDLEQKGGPTAFLFPGFIDTHTHASQYPNTGIFGNSTLLDWLETYTFPLESSFSDPEKAQRVYNRVVSRSLSHGTTCAAYYATVHVSATNLLASICHSKGQRALIGRVCMDRLSPDYYRDESPETAARRSKESIEFIRALDPDGDLVRPCITPRFAPSCTMQCMEALGQLQRAYDCHVQTHISENKPEIALVRSQFPHSQHYAGVYDEAGLLTGKTILAHAVHLEPDEVELIRRREAHISHCPTSNTSLTSGAARVRNLLDSGINVSLGTDMSGGYSPSILEQARQTMLVSRHAAMDDGDRVKLNFEEALYLATVGGARAVGLEGRVGAFEAGMDFDAQLVRLAHVDASDGEAALDSSQGPVDVFGWESWEDRIAKWLYTGDDRNVRQVYVKGRLVHSM